MRVTFPNGKITVIRRVSFFGDRVCLIERKLNQNPLYFVTYKGTVLSMGSRKHCVRKFNKWVLPGHRVEIIGQIPPNYLTY